MPRLAISLLSVLLIAVLFVGCTEETVPDQQTSKSLIVYSGRSKALVDELVERFETETGIDVEVRYGTDAELLATLQEEGTASTADVFWANTAGALGAASNAGLFTALPDSLLQRPASFVPSSGLWVPITTRFRVLAYNSEKVSSDQLPRSVMDLPSLAQFKGRIGWTPAYSSFQDFVTAMRLTKGADTTRSWLQNMTTLEPKAYSSNTPMLQALEAGEIDIALTNHYYVLRLKQGGEEGEHEDEEEEEEEEEGEEEGHATPVATYYFAPGDIGNLVLVTGMGRLKNGANQDAALQFARYLLSPAAQEFAAEAVHEYPVLRGVTLPPYMMPADSSFAKSPQFDFERLRELDETLNLMREVGLL